MINIENKSKCSGCSACYSVCPQNAITMTDDEEGFLYPKVDKNKCINCGACKKVCPILNTSFYPKAVLPNAYLIYDTNSDWREKSAAGGGFSSVARYFIEKYNGIVFGAIYDENYNVFHKSFDTIEGIKKFQKSKYVQSNVQDTFKEVKENLLKKRYVLYSGTPCQIYGLKSYLGDLSDSDFLYCIDLSCHGVPSPKVFKEYLSFLQKQENSRIVSFEMRHKKLKKHSYEQGFSILFENGVHKFFSHSEDYFGRCFWGEISSRPSCYQCHYKTVWRISDITLGDCWFFNSFLPSEKDTLGVCMALVQSSKGDRLLEEIESLKKYRVNSEDLIKANGGMIYSSAIENVNRAEFFKRLGNMEFGELVDTYFPIKKKSTKQIMIEKCEDYGIRLEVFRRISRNKKLKERLKRVIPNNALGEMK